MTFFSLFDIKAVVMSNPAWTAGMEGFRARRAIN